MRGLDSTHTGGVRAGAVGWESRQAQGEFAEEMKSERATSDRLHTRWFPLSMTFLRRALRRLEAHAQPVVDVITPGPLVGREKERESVKDRSTATHPFSRRSLFFLNPALFHDSITISSPLLPPQCPRMWDAVARDRAVETVRRALAKGRRAGEAAGGGGGGRRSTRQ